MNHKLDVGVAGCTANVEYFKALRCKHIEQALEAYAEEMKWIQRLELQKNFGETLKSLAN